MFVKEPLKCNGPKSTSFQQNNFYENPKRLKKHVCNILSEFATIRYSLTRFKILLANQKEKAFMYICLQRTFKDVSKKKYYIRKRIWSVITLFCYVVDICI